MSRFSIRWRLPLSYAALALLTTLVLATVLLLTLQGHYLRVERDYLRSNARAIGYSLAPLLEQEPAAEELQTQLDSFAFLSRACVSWLDGGGQLVASSDPRGRVAVPLLAALSRESLPLDGRLIALIRSGDPLSTAIQADGVLPWLPGEPPLVPLPGEGERRVVWPLLAEEERLRGEVPAAETGSGQVVRIRVLGSSDRLLGYVELSHGPAYAREIVRNVAWGLGIAGTAAVLLAGLAGWLISRRISAPLLALARVTASMAQGNLSARAGVARRDELGTLARSFNQMADRVEQTVTTLRRFVSDAAHEIHTPLTALRTNLELARQDSPPESAAYVVQAQAQAERVEALAAGLLDLSRLEAPAQAPARVAVPLLPLLSGLGEQYASRAEQAGLAFELSLPEAHLSVLGEEPQLTAALTNLLDNAVKFTPQGGRICLGCRAEGGSAVLWVEDSGIGLEEADLPQLFERFYRGRSAAGYPGSGLGLAIVKAVVELHGGEVRAERAEQGARFTVRLTALRRGGPEPGSGTEPPPARPQHWTGG